MKTCDRLRECGFHSIRMMEVRQRPFDGRKHLFESVDLGLGEGQRPPPCTTSEIDVIGKEKKDQEREKSSEFLDFSKKRLRTKNLKENDSCKKSKSDENINGEENESNNNSNSNSNSNNNSSSETVLECETDEEKISREARELKQINYLERMASKYVLPIMPVKEVIIARPLSSMKGHTAFLTFAVRPPIVVTI